MDITTLLALRSKLTPIDAEADGKALSWLNPTAEQRKEIALWWFKRHNGNYAELPEQYRLDAANIPEMNFSALRSQSYNALAAVSAMPTLKNQRPQEAMTTAAFYHFSQLSKTTVAYKKIASEKAWQCKILAIKDGEYSGHVMIDTPQAAFEILVQIQTRLANQALLMKQMLVALKPDEIKALVFTNFHHGNVLAGLADLALSADKPIWVGMQIRLWLQELSSNPRSAVEQLEKLVKADFNSEMFKDCLIICATWVQMKERHHLLKRLDLLKHVILQINAWAPDAKISTEVIDFLQKEKVIFHVEWPGYGEVLYTPPAAHITLALVMYQEWALDIFARRIDPHHYVDNTPSAIPLVEAGVDLKTWLVITEILALRKPVETFTALYEQVKRI